MRAIVKVGDVVDGKYRIDQILGLGGMSVVARAWHVELGHAVALKILRCHDSNFEDAVRRFRREARVLAHIKSEHVVRIYNLGGMSDGSPYIVMELLDGNDLREEMDRKGRLSVAEATGYLLEALEAMAETHARDVVHRDLKPQNLFLTRKPDGTRCIKVLDFGVAKFFSTSSAAELSMTKTSWFIGTPLYMSPEQMRSARSVDHRTDIWSLGAILYEMVSGRVPYLADTIPELCTLLIEANPPPIRQLCPTLPAEFAAVIERCLQKDRTLRYSNVAELAVALAPFAARSEASDDRMKRVVRRCAISGPPGLFVIEPPRERGSRHERKRFSSAPAATGSLSPAVFASQRPPPPLAGWRQAMRWVSAHPAGTLGPLALLVVAALLRFSFSPERPVQERAESKRLEATGAPLANGSRSALAASSYETSDVRPNTALVASRAAAGQTGPNRSPRSLPEAPVSARRPTSLRVARRLGTAAPAAAPSPPTVEANGLNVAAPAPAPPPPRKVDAWDPSTFGGRH